MSRDTPVDVPQSWWRFPKFKEGQNRFRVIGERKVGWQYFVNAAKWVKKFIVEEKDDIPMEKVQEWKYGKSFGYFWAFPVYDYATKSVGILTVTQKSVINGFQEILADKDFSNPTEYDIKVKKTVTWDRTEYAITSWKHEQITEEIADLVVSTSIDMDAYYTCAPVEDIFTDISSK